mmetsp:Transcript_15938/g.50888  ORF Transcript_15938/g.50888 Transcript_15938/m.50888 type:complete len:216 (+) Transcript_15938:17-664(+)
MCDKGGSESTYRVSYPTHALGQVPARRLKADKGETMLESPCEAQSGWHLDPRRQQTADQTTCTHEADGAHSSPAAAAPAAAALAAAILCWAASRAFRMASCARLDASAFRFAATSSADGCATAAAGGASAGGAGGGGWAAASAASFAFRSSAFLAPSAASLAFRSASDLLASNSRAFRSSVAFLAASSASCAFRASSAFAAAGASSTAPAGACAF